MRLQTRAAGTIIIMCAVALTVLITIAAMATFGWGWFQRSTADFRGETDAIERIQADGDRRIAAHERFYDLCASVQAHEDTMAALKAELDTDPSDKRREQINATITANQAARDGKIRQYNSDAGNDYTAGQFRASDLPYQLDTNVKGTTCVASQ